MAIFQPVGSLTEFVLYKNRSRIGELQISRGAECKELLFSNFGGVFFICQCISALISLCNAFSDFFKE